MLSNIFKGKTQRTVFSGNFSNILNKYNLKKFGGPLDKDFDGVINKFDCQPNNIFRQDFVPFKYGDKSAELTAAKRFGGKNLSRLKKIGSGRDRIVYALDKDKVLKVAKNPGGISQNVYEPDLAGFLEQGKFYEYGKDYVVMGRADKPGKATNIMLEDLKQFSQSDFDKHTPKLQEVMERHNLQDFQNYELSYGDFTRKANWGEIEGKPVLIDGGTLSTKAISSYRQKDWEPGSWSSKNWEEIKQQRKQFKDKGSEDKINIKSEPQYEALGDFYEPEQNVTPKTFYYAGDIPPSQTLQQEGRVYGFTDKRLAEGWADRHNKSNVYKFSSEQYMKDPQTYSRKIPGQNKLIISSDEYIAGNVTDEAVLSGNVGTNTLNNKNNLSNMFYTENEYNQKVKHKILQDADNDGILDVADIEVINER